MVEDITTHKVVLELETKGIREEQDDLVLGVFSGRGSDVDVDPANLVLLSCGTERGSR